MPRVEREQVEQLQTSQAEAVRQARAELEELWKRTAGLTPQTRRDLLLDMVPAIAAKYGDMASAAAADWYELMRAKWFEPGYETEAAPPFDDKAMRQTIRRLAGHLWDKDDAPADPETMLRGLRANMDRWVKQPARDTIVRNARRDPGKPRYARVPAGRTTCAFCAMLASRGFVYASAEAAGGDMNRYHPDCDCEIIPSWDKKNPKIEGYDPDKLYDAYLKARDSLHKDDPTTEEILAAMREQGGYTDSARSGAGTGAPPIPPKRPISRQRGSWPHDPNESSILSLKNETNATDSEWERRQIAAGGPSPDIEKMYPQEIVFLERAKNHGEDIEWIPTGRDGKPRNDFKWLSHENALAELKSPAGTKYKNVAKRISDAIAVAKNHGVTKNVFVIDFGDTKLPEKLVRRLAQYNETHADAIKELWIWDAQGMRQIL